MTHLRPEDVKEAVGLLEADQALAGSISPAHALCDERAVAVMRAWLASQEQTPDYEAAAKQWYDSLMWSDQYRSWEELPAEDQASYVHRATRAVDAALVGLHPQPSKDECQHRWATSLTGVTYCWKCRMGAEQTVVSPEVPT